MLLVAFDEAFSFERQHHLMDRRRADAKILLHVGFGRRAAVQAQILLAADAGASDDDDREERGRWRLDHLPDQAKAGDGRPWMPHSAKNRGPAFAGNYRARKRPCLWRRPAPTRLPGRARWTLELFADAMVRLTDHESFSGETVRRRLAENGLKPWRRDMWCIPKVDGEYVARMEDVLDLYAEAPDPKRPVVCFDESPAQLIGEVRQPIPAEPGRLERYDYEYRRNGTVNLFVFLDGISPGAGSRSPSGGTARDFADCMRELVDVDLS